MTGAAIGRAALTAMSAAIAGPARTADAASANANFFIFKSSSCEVEFFDLRSAFRTDSPKSVRRLYAPLSKMLLRGGHSRSETKRTGILKSIKIQRKIELK